jgi:hypothetical protein
MPMMLTVQPMHNETTLPDGGITLTAVQSAHEGGVTLEYFHGSDPSEIDSGAFDAVTVTVLAMPAKDGDPLTLRAHIHFVDGRVLDETFTGPLVSLGTGCAAAG